MRQNRVSSATCLGRLAAACLIAGMLGGCAALKASPAPDRGFIPPAGELVEVRGETPFNKLLTLPPDLLKQRIAAYHKIFVAEVDTSFVQNSIREKGMPPRFEQQRLEELAEVARYTRERFRNGIIYNDSHPLRVVDQPQEGTLLLEVALVELAPTNTVANTLGTVLGAVLPGGGLLKLFAKGAVAIEARLKDSSSKEVLVAFKDRERDKSAPFSVKDFQEYAHTRRAIDEWADQFTKLSAGAWSKPVGDSAPFTLKPF